VLTNHQVILKANPLIQPKEIISMTPEERNEFIARYADGYQEVLNALEGFPNDSLGAHPIPGKWSAKEIVHHLADSEGTSAIRLRRLLVEDNPVIQGYDEAEFARRLKYNERDMAPAMDAFRAARATTAQLLSMMSDADWQREGTHSESGRYTPEHWLTIYAAHAHNHAAQIRRLRDALNT
jgi:DinB superfamily